MFYANQVALIGDRLSAERSMDRQRDARRQSTFSVPQSTLRLVAGVVITMGLLFSVGATFAAPAAAGPFECGLGECQTTSTTMTAPRLAGGPDGPRLLP